MLKLQLGIKNIPKKKIILYSVLIILSIAGTGFFLYENHKISSPTKITNITSIDMISVETSEDIIKQAGEKVTQEIKPLDSSILNSDKFKALKETIFKEIEIETGRDNPFEDPFKED